MVPPYNRYNCISESVITGDQSMFSSTTMNKASSTNFDIVSREIQPAEVFQVLQTFYTQYVVVGEIETD